MKKIDNEGKLFGLDLFSNDKGSLLSFLRLHLHEGKKAAYIFTPNPEQIIQAKENHQFHSILHQADILIPDGIGLVVASKALALTGKTQPLKERIPGVDVVQDLLEVSRREGYQVLLIGGRDYNPSQLPQENFVWTPGYENIEQPSAAEEAAITKLLEELKPKVVFVAFGAPWQETWLIQHRPLLEKNGVRVAMAVGGSFDYLTGTVPRAPKLIQAAGGEWLYRLLRQPWRAKRQTRLLKFIKLTLQELRKNEKAAAS